MKGLGIVALVITAIVVLTHSGGGDKKSAHASAKPSGPDFTVKMRRSYVLDEGITDVWTGDGKLRFFVKVHNNTSEQKTFDFQPIRRYDDGEENRSAMDLSTCDVPANGSLMCWGDFDYEAHKHGLASAAIEHDGTTYELRVVS